MHLAADGCQRAAGADTPEQLIADRLERFGPDEYSPEVRLAVAPAA